MIASVRHWLLCFGEMDEDVPLSLAQLSHLTPAVQLQTPLSLGGGRSLVARGGSLMVLPASPRRMAAARGAWGSHQGGCWLAQGQARRTRWRNTRLDDRR